MARGKARLPPRWFVVTFWHVHRWIVRATGRRKGLWPPRPGKWGALRLTTQGRRSGEPRSVIIGYYEDGDNLVSMAMSGWGPAEPARRHQLHDRLRPHLPQSRHLKPASAP
jgi:F420H(2)-dependent quinone reductase